MTSNVTGDCEKGAWHSRSPQGHDAFGVELAGWLADRRLHRPFQPTPDTRELPVVGGEDPPSYRGGTREAGHGKQSQTVGAFGSSDAHRVPAWVVGDGSDLRCRVPDHRAPRVDRGVVSHDSRRHHRRFDRGRVRPARLAEGPCRYARLSYRRVAWCRERCGRAAVRDQLVAASLGARDARGWCTPLLLYRRPPRTGDGMARWGVGRPP